MNQENQVAFTSVQNLPLKRKRGRPRKDGSLTRVEKSTVVTVGSDTRKGKAPWNTNSASSRDDTLLGKAVSGVLDGSFDAGYLVTVKVGETNTVLRGVLFKPDAVIPITEANDVASNVQMLKRNEIFPNVPNRLHVLAQREQNSKQTASTVMQVPEVVPTYPSQGQSSADVAIKDALIGINQNREQMESPPVKHVSEVVPMSPSQGQSSTDVAMKEALIAINQVPQASPHAVRQAEIRNMSSSQLLSGGQVTDTSQVVQLSAPSTYSQKSLDSMVPRNCGTSSLIGAALNDKDRSEDSKQEHNSEPTVETFQGNATDTESPDVKHQDVEPVPVPVPERNLKADGVLQAVDLSNETNGKAPEVGHQVVEPVPVPGPNPKADVALKYQAVDLNRIPIDAEPDFVAVEPTINLIMKDKAFEDKQNSVATVTQGLATEVNERPSSEVMMNAIEQEPQFELKLSINSKI